MSAQEQESLQALLDVENVAYNTVKVDGDPASTSHNAYLGICIRVTCPISRLIRN